MNIKLDKGGGGATGSDAKPMGADRGADDDEKSRIAGGPPTAFFRDDERRMLPNRVCRGCINPSERNTLNMYHRKVRELSVL